MKNLYTLIAILGCVVVQTNGQVTVGLKIAKSPTVTPGTNHLFVNSQDPVNESLFNVEQVRYSEQLGLMARLDHGKFWFMSELMYGQSTTQYSMMYTRETRTGEQPTLMNEKRAFLELPFSAGVSLGILEVFSGFSLAHDFGYKNELEHMEGYSATLPALRLGWHSGIGVNFGHILVDVRYQQEFGNYGQDRYINGEQLLLKNAPGRLVATAGFRI